MPDVDARTAVKAVRDFIRDLFGAQQVEYSRLEEIEYFEEDNEWLITMSIASPTAVVLGRDVTKDLKRFVVSATTGEVLSMRIWQS